MCVKHVFLVLYRPQADALHSELDVLSERYSQKCLELNRAEQRGGIESREKERRERGEREKERAERERRRRERGESREKEQKEREQRKSESEQSVIRLINNK
jgi:hypothetical protein